MKLDKQHKKLLDFLRIHLKGVKERGYHFVRISELLALKKNLTEGEVRWCMHKLNLEGMVTKAQHVRCHDYGGKDHKRCWHPDVYYFNKGV